MEEGNHGIILTYRFLTTLGRGELFRVEVWPKKEWETEGDELAKIIHIAKIGELDDKVYAFATPSDVEYDPNNQRAKEQYLSLARDVDQVKASFTIGK
ncbi:hypothetical protein N6H14_03995 [Paenibacillus sp. CC-CFT747]|nr:hypothetical protein N6H14_03995 [Paenibacillus sp. CC-CFT747]